MSLLREILHTAGSSFGQKRPSHSVTSGCDTHRNEQPPEAVRNAGTICNVLGVTMCNRAE